MVWRSVLPAVRARCHDLLAGLELPFEPVTDRFAQMRGFRVEHPDPEGLQRRLYDEHRVEVPIVETARGWILRVSVQAYNDEDDLSALVSGLARCLSAA